MCLVKPKQTEPVTRTTLYKPHSSSSREQELGLIPALLERPPDICASRLLSVHLGSDVRRRDGDGRGLQEPAQTEGGHFPPRERW